MELGIVAGDVVTYLIDIFGAMWPILALGLGIAAAPWLIGACKAVFSRK